MGKDNHKEKDIIKEHEDGEAKPESEEEEDKEDKEWRESLLQKCQTML